MSRFLRRRFFGPNVETVKAETIDVILPCLDEAEALPWVLGRMPSWARPIVADNGSTDGSPDIARSLGATVVEVSARGYGAACAGALTALDDDTDTIVFMDADGSDDHGDMIALLEPIREGRADLVIGSRALGIVDAGALTLQQRFGNRLATLLIRILYGRRFTDLGPFRAIRRDLLDSIDMQDRRFGWTVEMQVRAIQLDAVIVEVPVRYRQRVGRSKISGTVTGVLKAGWWILYTIFKYARRAPTPPI